MLVETATGSFALPLMLPLAVTWSSIKDMTSEVN